MTSLIIAGATGAIGRAVVQLSVNHTSITKVVALTRQTPSETHTVEEMFGLRYTTTDSPCTGVDKVQTTTFDWEHFCSFWTRFSSVSIEEQEMLERFEAPFCEDKVEGTEDPQKAKNTTDDEEKLSSFLPSSPHAVVTLRGPKEETFNSHSSLPVHLHSLKKDYEHYKKVFSGHHYAAICLGTTKSDAGSMQKFVRCDYTYVLAFTEAILCFSGAAGWDVTGDDQLLPLYGDEGSSTRVRTPSWLTYRFGDPNMPPGSQPYVSSRATTDSSFLKFYQNGRQQTEVVPLLRTRSSKTLQGITLISSSGASPSSWIGYLKTKGAAEESVAERVIIHNKLVRAYPGEQKDSSGILTLSILRPGALNRGAKARTKEKFVMFLTFNTAIKVETCAECIVNELLECSKQSKSVGTKKRRSLSIGLPYPNAKFFDVAEEPIFFLSNKQIYQQVSSISHPLRSEEHQPESKSST